MLRRLFTIPALLVVLAGGLSAQNLEIYWLSVGQGDSMLIISPTGTTFLLDAGDNGKGNSVVIPFLQSKGITSLDYVCTSHYHADHLGGLDEVWNAGIRATVAYDRGTNNTPGTQSYSSYASRYAGVRQQVTPGQVVNLGGGVTMTCVVVEGDLMGGGSVNISGSSQWENSASIGWHLRYGDFDLYTAGDLTGGGNGTTNVESSVAPLVGNVDVAVASHHGSRTSSNSTLVNALDPEFVVVSCGHANVFGYPKQEVLDRWHNSGWSIPVWVTTDGIGTEGFVDAGGHIQLETDGDTYTVTALVDGTTFTAHVDEQVPTAPAAGDLVVGEFMRDPVRVSDTDGEYVELTGARESEAVSLNSVSVRDAGSDSFLIRSGIFLEAGDECLIGADGLPGRNGGYRPIMVWPTGRFSLLNTDTIRLLRGVDLDRVDYASNWPGASGTAAERMDLLGSAAQSNFTNAVSPYGLGDRGTPGETNDGDTTQWGGPGGGSYVEVIVPPMLGLNLVMDWHAEAGEAGALFQGCLTLGTTPGHLINGTNIPANQDKAYFKTINLNGWAGLVPAGEVMRTWAPIPNKPSLLGLQIYAVFYTYKDIAGTGIDIRTIAPPEAMTIQ